MVGFGVFWSIGLARGETSMRIVRRSIAVVTVTTLLAVGVNVAFASTVSFNTKLTLRSSVTGHKAVFRGDLTSPKARCVKNSTIKLIRVGRGVKDTTTTDADGHYSFPRRRVAHNSDWRTRFPGKVLSAVHPNTRTCDSSRSPVNHIS
jgi:hypothetical protein